MKISEKQIRNLVREEILREHKKSLKEDKAARLARRLRRAQRLAQRAGNDEVAAELDDLIAMSGDPEEEGGEQSARAGDEEPQAPEGVEAPAELSDEEIDMPNDDYTYVYDKAASDATVASGREGEVQLHFTVASGPQNVGGTFALTAGHPLGDELRKQERVMQDLERAEGGEQVTVVDADVEEEEEEVQMESRRRGKSRKTLSRSKLRKMLQREAYRALIR